MAPSPWKEERAELVIMLPATSAAPISESTMIEPRTEPDPIVEPRRTESLTTADPASDPELGSSMAKKRRIASLSSPPHETSFIRLAKSLPVLPKSHHSEPSPMSTYPRYPFSRFPSRNPSLKALILSQYAPSPPLLT